jgi:hypothetical protein
VYIWCVRIGSNPLQISTTFVYRDVDVQSPIDGALRASSMHSVTGTPYYKLECHNWFSWAGANQGTPIYSMECQIEGALRML